MCSRDVLKQMSILLSPALNVLTTITRKISSFYILYEQTYWTYSPAVNTFSICNWSLLFTFLWKKYLFNLFCSKCSLYYFLKQIISSHTVFIQKMFLSAQSCSKYLFYILVRFFIHLGEKYSADILLEKCALHIW
jgi:hypothetical protein